MKTKLYFLLSLILLFANCKKEDDDIPPVERDPLLNTEWVLIGARVYTENLDNEALTWYDHFSGNQIKSNLDIFGGSALPIDEIIMDVTQWRFGNSKFILNNNQAYDYTVYNNVVSVYGLEDGSARPIEVLEHNETLTVRIHEGNESYNGTNYSYFSTLTFVSKDRQCINCNPDVLEGYSYGGILSPTQDNNSICWNNMDYHEICK